MIITPLKPVSMLLIGKASSAGAAQQYAARNQLCPYVASLVCKGQMIRGLFVIPEALKGHVEFLPHNPERLGMEQVAVFFSRDIKTTSPWSSGKVRPSGDESPCGSSCLDCKSYRSSCPGCPATDHYPAPTFRV